MTGNNILSPRHRDQLLIVSPDAERVRGWVDEKISPLFEFTVDIAFDAMRGIKKMKHILPALIIVDDKLPDMSGMSFASIVKDSIEGADSTIYLYNVTSLLQNAKADYFLPVLQSETELKNILLMQVKAFFENRFIFRAREDEINAKRAEQIESLPKDLKGNGFEVSTIFSPFDMLSGDGFDYWLGEDTEKNDLFGFLFDCTGHGPSSYPLVGSIRASLKKSCKLYQIGFWDTLADVMKDVNFDIFNTSPSNSPDPGAAIVFYIDASANVMKFCTGGVPGYFIKKHGEEQFTFVPTRGWLLGFIPEAEFKEEEISLEGVDELMFSSDGLSEILYHRNELQGSEAKHDDVSAITIQLRRQDH